MLEDIDAQRIQCVMVYKVDRLSRSLLDFARLIDRFEQRSVSFVSVTQQFNTTTSLGRLTLNILLSFAQFERDLVGERTRDKMAAARRKGKWTGGTPVLGYDVSPHGGRLVANQTEARRVREMFRLYERHGSVPAVLEDLQRRHWTTKSWTTQQGSRHQGSPFTKATLLRLLTNTLYLGKVEHQGAVYAGEHAAIVEPEVWEKVNEQLRVARRGETAVRTPGPSLLQGLLYCGRCARPMAHTYAAKGGRCYRYYVCRAARRDGTPGCARKFIAAGVLEESVREQMRSALRAGTAAEPLSEELLRARIRRVVYDATTRAVSVELGDED